MQAFAIACLVPLLVGPGDLRVHDVQGSAHVSPLTGSAVDDLPGVVTALWSKGFYLQDPAGDGDDATSEGVRVASSNTVRVGDAVLVSGLVQEPRDGCRACSADDAAYANLTTTEIAASRVTIVTRGASLPPPVPLGLETGERHPPRRADQEGPARDVEAEGWPFDPARVPIDFFESLEGMRVRIEGAVAVGPTFRLGSEATVAVVPHGASDPDAHVVLVSSGPHAVVPEVDGGDRFAGPIDGILDYSSGSYKLVVANAPIALAKAVAPGRTPLGPPRPGELTLATFNLKNFGPESPSEKLERIAEIVVEALQAPDVVALEEVEDDSGPSDDGTTGASETLRELVNAVAARGGPFYEAREIPPSDGQDGGAPGGNIRVALLLRRDRGLSIVDRPGASAHVANSTRGEGAELELAYSPGRIDPDDVVFEATRKPLAIELRFAGAALFVIANHLSSQLGDLPLLGRFQPPTLLSRPKRVGQARVVGRFVQDILGRDPRARVVVLGDLNDVESSPPLAALGAAGLHDLLLDVPPRDRYTTIFQGDAEAIDHILVPDEMVAKLAAFRIEHVNADFAGAISDHDPVVARFDLAGDEGHAGSTCSLLPSRSSRAASSPWGLVLLACTLAAACIRRIAGRGVLVAARVL